MRFTSRLLVAAFAFAVPLPLLGAQGSGAAANISVIPRPQSVAAGRGTFTFTSRTVIWSDRADSAVCASLFAQPRAGDRAGSARANRDVGERKQNRLSAGCRA